MLASLAGDLEPIPGILAMAEDYTEAEKKSRSNSHEMINKIRKSERPGYLNPSKIHTDCFLLFNYFFYFKTLNIANID